MKLRNCFREPIKEIFEAADYLNQSIYFHQNNEFEKAENCIIKADIPEIREWTESIWGKNSPYIFYQKLPNSPSFLDKNKRVEIRMPDTSIKLNLIKRDGYNCKFCGIPLIRAEVRNRIKRLYPKALKWERTNINQHAAFQAMWLQYDHVLPHSRGGNNDLENLLITCAPCNFGRMQYTLDEVSLANPLKNKVNKTEWNGLEEFMKL
jgi:5-methylcytosine-specific restriction endonuclease McrA